MSDAQFPYKKIVSSILAVLPPKGRDVLVRRFGLAGTRQTLQEIGTSYKITRERVRQIESFCLKTLRAQKAMFASHAPLFSYLEDYCRSYGGVRREDTLLRDLGQKTFAPHVLFLLTIGAPFNRKSETENSHSLWYTEKGALDLADAAVAKTIDFFRKTGVPLAEDKLSSWATDALAKEMGISLSSKAFFSYVETSKAIAKNPFGEYGLREFPEIYPRGMRDEAYIVLRRGGSPLHFVEVAKAVTTYRKKYLGERDFANPQTIHNELIKDPRFVLVGRGMYALREWGYTPGVVRDVIVRVLSTAGKPLPKDEILRLVRQQRFVQDNTISLNLHNRRHFKRTPDGLFTLRA